MKGQVEAYHAKGKVFPVLVGNKVTLKSVGEGDFYKKYEEWLGHEEVIKWIGKEELTKEEIIQMHSEWKENPANLTLGIYENKTQKPLGDINLFDSEEFENGPEIGIMVGERGKGFGTEAMKLMLEYAFKIIKTSRVNLIVYKDSPAVKLYQKIGFGIIKEKQDDETGKEEYEMSLEKENWEKQLS